MRGRLIKRPILRQHCLSSARARLPACPHPTMARNDSTMLLPLLVRSLSPRSHGPSVRVRPLSPSPVRP